MLDVGCGNGRLLTFLNERGWHGRYLGVDSSAGLLDAAEKHLELSLGGQLSPPICSVRTGPRRPLGLRPTPSPAWLCCITFQAPRTACGWWPNAPHLLKPGGTLIVSVWQFLEYAALRARILPWSAAGLSDEEVDPGDYVLSWGEGAIGHRYCAAIDEEMLCALAQQAGLATVETFYADGHEGNLGLYGVFRSTAT